MTREYATPPKHAPRTAPLQASSRPVVGPVGDPAERIADRIADGVMSSSGSPGHLGPSLASGSAPVAAHEAPEVVRDVVRSPGQPLDSRTRAFFEPRFGYDFSQVRIHAGDRARDSARAIGARAYTVGSHIVFGEESAAPSQLMAHELAHVMVESHLEVARAARPVARREPDPGAWVPKGVNFTAADIELLRQARAALRPTSPTAIVGVLVPQGGEPIFLQSGGGQGFYSHIEGKATIVMRKQGITQAKLIVELEPCLICDRSTYPGPDVPVEGITSPVSGKQISLQTSKINSALPSGTKLTVVGPETTGLYEGVGPKVSPETPVVPFVEDPHPDPAPPQTTRTPTTSARAPTTKAPTSVTTPDPVAPPAVEPAVPTPAVEPAPKAPVVPLGEPVPSFSGSLKTGLKAAFSAENIAAAIPGAVLAVADRVAAREAIRNIKVKFAKEGFAKGVAAGVMSWSGEEVASNLKNRVTEYRLQGLEDPAGFLTSAYIFQLAEAFENYAVDLGYRFSSSQTPKWKEEIRTKGFAVLVGYGYEFRGDPQVVLFDYNFIDKLAWVIRPTTDPIVDDAIQKGEERKETPLQKAITKVGEAGTGS